MKHNTKIYAQVLEDEALQQFNEAMSLKCNIQGALMPDAHTGYTLPIGAVIKSKEHIFPAYVGYDIGCGMCAVKLDIFKEDIDLEDLKQKIIQKIPLGFTKHKKVISTFDISGTTKIAQDIYNSSGKYYLGTLGGGNHFIELGVGDDKKVWIIIHSGSRGYGYKIAEYYMEKAALYDKNIKDTDTKIEGHYSFHINSQDGKDYIKDMNSALDFALLNRQTMIDTIKQILNNPKELIFINKNHNHAIIEDNYIIHRKGATSPYIKTA